MKSTHSGFDISKYDCLLFDFDGVILDSVNIKTEAFRDLYKAYGADIVERVTRHHLANGGMSRFEKFRLYHKEFLGKSLTDDEVDELAGRFSRLVFDKVVKVKFISGAPEFLNMCRDMSKMCFVVSSTPEAEINKIAEMRNLNGFFKSVKGSPRSKEQNIRDLVEKYGLNCERCVFFGDSINDLRAAEANGIEFIGINYSEPGMGYENFTKILKKGADK